MFSIIKQFHILKSFLSIVNLKIQKNKDTYFKMFHFKFVLFISQQLAYIDTLFFLYQINNSLCSILKGNNQFITPIKNYSSIDSINNTPQHLKL